MAIFVTVWMKKLFRKYDYNFFEVLILSFYVFGMGMLVFPFFGIIETLINLNILQIGALIVFIYSSWAIGQFFDERKIVNYLKAFSSYTLGFISFFIIVMLLEVFIDLLISGSENRSYRNEIDISCS